MSDDSNAPAPPNYGPVTSGLSQIANTAESAGAAQSGVLTGLNAKDQATTDNVVGQDVTQQGNQFGFSGDIQNQYESTYVPLEEKFANEAENYASPGQIDVNMGQAGATAAHTADQAKANTISDLESFGINPNATRFAALDAGLNAQKGASVAGAENNARTNTVNTGLGLESQAIGQGEVMPSMSAGLTNEGLMAGSGAVNSNLATTSTNASTLGTNPQYLSIANGSYGTYGNVLNNEYQNQIEQFNANQNASSGLGMLAGAGLGMLGMGTGGGNTIGGSLFKMAFARTGGAIGEDDYGSTDRPFVDHHFYAYPGRDEHGRQMGHTEAMHRFFRTGEHHGVFASPDHADAYLRSQANDRAGSPADKNAAPSGAHAAVGKAYDAQNYPKKMAVGGEVDNGDGTQGGQLTPNMSPSRGAVTDDIPATNTDTGQPIRLNSGEFIIPKDVMRWKGEEWAQKEIQKARQARQQGTVAHPTSKPPAQQRAAVG